MLAYRLPGTPRPIDPNSAKLDWLWNSEEGLGPDNPWGGPGRLLSKAVTWVPDRGVPTDCFTFELWVLSPGAVPDDEHPFVASACNENGLTWSFGLTRHLRPKLVWRNRSNQLQSLLGDSLIDLFVPAGWVHLAVVHHGDGGDPMQAADEYARWTVYATPAGEAWPRLVLQECGARTAMPAASGSLDLQPSAFNYAQAACFSHAKLPNEFPTLGQDPPADVTFDSGFKGGSHHAPVAVGPNRVIVGCGEDVTDANYWFRSKVSLPKAKPAATLDLTVLAAPRGQAMLNCLFYSTDGARWQRLAGGWYGSDRGVAAQGFLRVDVPTDAARFELAAAPPYDSADANKLISDLTFQAGVRVLELGQTTGGKPIRGLAITSPEGRSTDRSVLYLQAGQHSPMEQATGRVLDQLARALVSNDRYKSLLLTHEVHLVPLINHDTADAGGAGLTLHRLNSNRYWLGRRCPETTGIRAHLEELFRRGRRVSLALDLHAGGVWPHHVSLYLGEDRALALCRPGWSGEMSRWLEVLEQHTGISRRDAMQTGEGLTHFAVAVAVKYGWTAATLEFSFNTYRDLDGTVKPVTQEHLEDTGVRLAEALAAYGKG